MTGKQVIFGVVYGVLAFWLVLGTAVYYTRFTRHLLRDHAQDAEQLWQAITALF